MNRGGLQASRPVDALTALSHRSDGMMQHLVIFTLHDLHYGLPLGMVDRVVRAVEITPLPRAPQIVLGVVNVQGRVIPVVDVRRRFGLPERGISLTDQMIIAHTARRPVALVVDSVSGVLDYSEAQAVDGAEVLSELDYIRGVVKRDDGLILIHDLDTFLSLEEQAGLDWVLERDS